MEKSESKIFLYFVSSSISYLMFISINLLFYFIENNVGSSSSVGYVGFMSFIGSGSFLDSLFFVILISIPFIYITTFITYLVYFLIYLSNKKWNYIAHIIIFSFLSAIIWSKVFFELEVFDPIFFILLFSGISFLFGLFCNPSKISIIICLLPVILLIGSFIGIRIIY